VEFILRRHTQLRAGSAKGARTAKGGVHVWKDMRDIREEHTGAHKVDKGTHT
jgi:mevalonate pyrophosphate decarboxylase